jgi:hypothetical protein
MTTTGRDRQLKEFWRTLREAAKYGVEKEYRRRFKALRKAFVPEAEAAPMALKEAVAALDRAKLGVTVVLREGRS